MAKLNPPILENLIPPMVKPEASTTARVVIPYVMNRSVGIGDVSGIKVKFRTIGGIQIGEVEDASSYTETEVVLNALDVSKFNVGQYYKVQIAYVDGSDEIGYYSSVGIIKYIAAPSISCTQRTDLGDFYYRGVYTPNEEDKTEKFYSSHFDLYENNVLIESTEEKLHMDSDSDYEDYEIRRDLDFDNNTYRVEFVATSVNKYVGAALVNVVPQELDTFPTQTQLIATNNYENGYVQLTTTGEALSSDYTYTIWRKANNSENWEKLNIIFIQPYQDFTVEHGITYTYAIQGIPNGAGNATEKLLAQPLAARFEDICLGDKDKHLRIQYNPKINSFKRTILESKIDTIGSKYPMIMRNGNVDYREIGIGGLISYLIDPDELFMDFEDEQGNKYRPSTVTDNTNVPPLPTALSDENRYKERLFREAVLTWLTNGEPKYFRSPTEGNHIIRVMNVSLTPNDTLGRLIYSFSATGYEIDDNTYDNLVKDRLAGWEA